MLRITRPQTPRPATSTRARLGVAELERRDTPASGVLSTGYSLTGHVSAQVAAFPVPDTSATGSLAVTDVPGGARIARATVYANLYESPGTPSLEFAGQPLGGGAAAGASATLSARKWDVTGLVTGNGSYEATVAVSEGVLYGVALVVVFEHTSLPPGAVLVNEGMVELAQAGTADAAATTFNVPDAGQGFAPTPEPVSKDLAGRLTVWTGGDDLAGGFPAGTGEQITLNGTVVGGPLDQNLGHAASLVRSATVPLTAGINTAAVTVPQQDWMGWGLAVLSVQTVDTVTLAWTTDEDEGNLRAFRVPLVDGPVIPKEVRDNEAVLGRVGVTVDWGDGDGSADSRTPQFYEGGRYTVAVTKHSYPSSLTATFDVSVGGIDPVPDLPAETDTLRPVTLNWSVAPQVSVVDYVVRRAVTGEGGDYEAIAEVPNTFDPDQGANTGEFTDQPPDPSRDHKYEVLARLADGSQLVVFTAASPAAGGAPPGNGQTPPLVTRLGTATQVDVDYFLPRLRGQGQARANPNQGTHWVGIRDVTIGRLDTFWGWEAHAVGFSYYIKSVTTDGRGDLTKTGGHRAALDWLQDAAMINRAGVQNLGNGGSRTTLQDGTVLTATKDGDWGRLVLRRAVGGEFTVRFVTPVRNVGFNFPTPKGPRGGKNEIDRLDDMRVMVEEKTAWGLLSEKNQGPNRATEVDWSRKHVFKLQKRLSAIGSVNHTFPEVGAIPYVGPPDVPSAELVNGLRQVVFEIEGDWQDLKDAVQADIVRLRAAFSGFDIRAVHIGRRKN